jgi:hypothetical protein
MQKIRRYFLGITSVAAAWLGGAATAWAAGLISPPTIDITNGTMNLDSGAGQTLNTNIQTWLSVVVVIAIIAIGINLAYHAWKMSHGDERTRADGTKGILHSIIAIIIVASLWLIISWAVGMV